MVAGREGGSRLRKQVAKLQFVLLSLKLADSICITVNR